MSGIIYKITCNETGECYVGSTIQTLNIRISNHKTHLKNYEEGITKNKACTSFSIIRRGNFKSEVLETIDFGEDKKLLLVKEREWIEQINPINTKRPIITQEDRNKAVRDYRKTEVGKLKKQIQDKAYREGEKREELLEKKREWNKQNREKNKDKLSESIMCECGHTYTFQHKARHMKTERHMEAVNKV